MATTITVFVSHKQEDARLALGIGERLKVNGLGYYLDVVDQQLTKDGPDLGDYLRRKLGECDQLLAVVSGATKFSWWVPWEIGVATEKNYRIATFLKEDIDTPGYLQKWPYLRNAQHIDEYARLSKVVQAEVLAKAQIPGRILESERSAGARDFHRLLKRSLGQ